MSYVGSVADGQKSHVKVVLSDHSTRPGDPHVTIIFRLRSAEWRMVLCSRFGFLALAPLLQEVESLNERIQEYDRRIE